MPIYNIEVNSTDVAELVGEIEALVEGRNTVHVVIACTIVSILAQKPDITGEELQECVKVATDLVAACLLNESPTKSIN